MTSYEAWTMSRLKQMLDDAIARVGKTGWQVATLLDAGRPGKGGGEASRRRRGYRVLGGETRLYAEDAIVLGAILHIDPLDLMTAAAQDDLDKARRCG